mgnify:CR=1 FL=1
MNKIRNYFSILIILFSTLSVNVFSQQSDNLDNWLNTITTSVPFLIISPDAKSGGMGDVGVASSPDAMSMHWNPAKYVFREREGDLARDFSFSSALFRHNCLSTLLNFEMHIQGQILSIYRQGWDLFKTYRSMVFVEVLILIGMGHRIIFRSRYC